jgi:very-short-patch-repair endonuclease
MEALRRDREKLAALQDLGWMVVPIVTDDVRRQPSRLVDRLRAHLDRAAVA